MSKADESTVTEEQVQAANEAEQKKWEGDFPETDLTIPYKREDDAEGTKPKATEEPKTDVPEDEEEVPETVTYADPEPLVTVQDPGEYTPGDYSFEVVLKDGKTKKISTPEQAEALADDPDNFETPKQLMEFINKQNKMNTSLDRDREKYDTQKKTFDDQTASESERLETINTLANEFKYLEDKKMIPKVPAEYRAADWTDPEVANKPGVKEQIDLLNYMTKENASRKKAGVKELSSAIDAYSGWQLEVSKSKEADETKAAGEARKAAGARVAGSSPAQQGSFVPKGIAVGNPNVFKRGAAVWDN